MEEICNISSSRGVNEFMYTESHTTTKEDKIKQQDTYVEVLNVLKKIFAIVDFEGLVNNKR